MSTHVHKCSNCGGGLKFDPKSQNFLCDYCRKQFTEDEIKAKNIQEDEKEKTKLAKQEETVFYSCPKCAAEIMTDATTAATHCFYCRNSVILTDRLVDDFKPDAVIPFSVEKKVAIDAFSDWVIKKRFVPKDFAARNQIEKVIGVYFPAWYVDCKVKADLTATGTKVRSWSDRRYTYQETKYYNVERSGRVSIKDIPKKALSKEESKLYESVLPFDESKAVDFTSAYLSGFQADKRNIEAKELKKEVRSEARQYAKKLFNDTVNGYATVTDSSFAVDKIKMNWKYTLLPVWTVTYQEEDQTYFYAMNGQTGKVSGQLPVDAKKLMLTSVAISVVLFILTIVIYRWRVL